MRRRKRLGRLEIDLSPPNEAQKQVEAELRAFRDIRRRRKVEAQTATERALHCPQGAAKDPATPKTSKV